MFVVKETKTKNKKRKGKERKRKEGNKRKQKRGGKSLNVTEYVLYEELARNYFIVVIKALPHSIPYAILVMESNGIPGGHAIFLSQNRSLKWQHL